MKFNKYQLIIILIIFLHYVWKSINPVSKRKKYNYNDIYLYKSEILKRVPKEFKLDEDEISHFKQLTNINYPVIFKPLRCTGSGYGVQKINNLVDAVSYYKKYKKPFISQQFTDHKYEIGLLIRKKPFQKKAKIVSIVQKVHKNNSLKCGNGCKCGCINKSEWITDKLTDAVNNIVNSIDPNIYYGRFDIKFTDANDLKNGKNFVVIEFNGNMSYDLRGFESSRYDKAQFIIAFLINNLLTGLYNVATLNGMNVMHYLFDTYHRLFLYINGCNNWEVLMDEWG